MKKSLIALAALAAFGTVSAQSTVALTGKLRFSYGQTESAAGAKVTGIAVTDGDWNIAATEDLGGGLKAGANMALRLRGRDAANDTLSGNGIVAGNGARPRDSSLFVSGGFGTVTVGAIEAGNGLLPLLTAGGPTFIGLDNGVQLAAPTNTDMLSYRTPTMSGFSAVAMKLDNVGAGGAEAASVTADATLFGVNYANGPLSAALDITNYSANSYTALTGIALGLPTGAAANVYSSSAQAAITAAGIPDTRTRMSANYDLGIARVAIGYQTAKNAADVTKKETGFGVSAPFGAFNVGAVYATSKTDGVAGNNKGYDLAVQYNLSKRTYVAFQAQSTKTAGATASATNQRVQLAHSF
jgi:hypothetical protein